jgi:hypothetical protein
MKSTNMEKYGVDSYAKTDESKSISKKRNASKRNRDIVKKILKETSQKERKIMGLGRGWYQRDTTLLKEIYEHFIKLR